MSLRGPLKMKIELGTLTQLTRQSTHLKSRNGRKRVKHSWGYTIVSTLSLLSSGDIWNCWMGESWPI